LPQFTCPACGTVLTVQDQTPASSLRCPLCQEGLRPDRRPRTVVPKVTPLPASATVRAAPSRGTLSGQAEPVKSRIRLLFVLVGCFGLALLLGTAAVVGVGYFLIRAQPEEPVADLVVTREVQRAAPSTPRPREDQSEAPPTSRQPIVQPHLPNATSPQPKEEPLQDPPVKVSVQALETEYRRDLVAADLKYRDKRIELSGVVGKVDKDDQGRYFIGTGSRRLVKTSDGGARVTDLVEAQRRAMVAALNARYLPGVVLSVKSADLKSFTGLDSTKAFTIRGRCKGSQKDVSTIPDLYVIVEDCAFVGVTPVQPQPSAPTRFSMTDVKESLEWLVAESAGVRNPTHNAIVDKQNRDALQRKLGDLKGKRIDWVVPVFRVEFGDVVFQSILGTQAGQLSLQAIEANSAGQRGISRLPEGSFRHSGGEWVGKLRRGSPVKLSGLIEGVRYRGASFVIDIKDYVLSPAD
jgi:hypothetical protein